MISLDFFNKQNPFISFSKIFVKRSLSRNRMEGLPKSFLNLWVNSTRAFIKVDL